MTETLSIILFVILLGLTAWENRKYIPKEDKPEKPLEHTVEVPKTKRQYIKAHYRIVAA